MRVILSSKYRVCTLLLVLSLPAYAVKPMAEDEMSDVSFNDTPLPFVMQSAEVKAETANPVDKNLSTVYSTNQATIHTNTLDPSLTGLSQSGTAAAYQNAGDKTAQSLGGIADGIGFKTGNISVTGVSGNGDLGLTVNNGQVGASVPVKIESIKLDSIQFQQPGLSGFSLQNIEFQNTTTTVHVR